MASLDRSYVLVRFSFGKENVKGRQRNTDTYRYKVEEIAVSYAENMYNEMKDKLTEGVENDVRRELVNLASLYRRFIIGANGNTVQPAGVIRSFFPGAMPLQIASVLPTWAPRTAAYMQRKINAKAGTGWFDNRKWVAQRGQSWSPEDPGLLFEKMRGDVWEQMFGPIHVTFTRNNKVSADNATNSFSTASGTNVKVQVGTIRVYALGEITPGDLPGLASGTIGIPSTSGNPGLMQLVENYDDRLSYRLGAGSSKGRYRPTLEPFLGYFLTRSIPAAVAARLEQGTLSKIRR